MSAATLRQRIGHLDGVKNRAECELAALELRDPHAALGVSGRRIQKYIEQCRDELSRLRDVLVFSRLSGVDA